MILRTLHRKLKVTRKEKFGQSYLFLWYTFKESRKVHHEFEIPSSNEGSEQKWKLWRNLVFWLFVLVGSAQLIVYGATNIAHEFGVPDVIVGITIVAL